MMTVLTKRFRKEINISYVKTLLQLIFLLKIFVRNMDF